MNKVSIAVAIILVVAVIGLVAYLVIEPKWIDDDWGTEIEITYTDGSTDELKTMSVLGIKYSDKDVSQFKYELFRRGTSSEFDRCDIDMASFFIGASIKDSAGNTEWTASITYGSVESINLDNQWHNVYELIIKSSDVITLSEGSYTLTFTPEGSITKEMPDGTSQDIPLPDGKSLTFTAEVIENGDDGEETRWINVEFSSNVIAQES